MGASTLLITVSRHTQYPSLQRGSLNPDASTFIQGHAGAMLQARRLGKELLVGIHSDGEIMDNKGPTVMTLKERWALTHWRCGSEAWTYSILL